MFGEPAMGSARLLPDGRIETLAPDGTEDPLPAQLYRIDSRTGARAPWRTLMPADPAGVTEIGPIVVARDGQSYAYSYRRVTSSDLFVVHPPR